MTQQEVIEGLAQALYSVGDRDGVELAIALVDSDAFRDWLAQRLADTWESGGEDPIDQADAILGREPLPVPEPGLVN